MKMNRYFPVSCLFLLLSAFTAFSQSRPNLSGDWVFNRAESKVQSPEDLRLSELVTLRIIQQEPELRVSTIAPGTGAVLSSSTFYTDGREVRTEDQRSIEKTKWDGTKIVTRRTPAKVEPERVGTRKPDRPIAAE